MYTQEEYNQYRKILDLFYDRQYPAFEQRVDEYKHTDAYQSLDHNLQHELEYYLAMSSLRQKEYEKSLARIEALEKETENVVGVAGNAIDVLALKAEVVVKMGKYDEGFSLFEQAFELVEDGNTFDDVSYRWESALDEVELIYKKPTFLKQIKERWEKIKQLLSNEEHV